MPYIDPRRQASMTASNVLWNVAVNAGELNYQLSQIIGDYMLEENPIGRLSYDKINEVIGVLECLKLELYRRIAAPYEDKKMEENGDVFSPELLTPRKEG